MNNKAISLFDNVPVWCREDAVIRGWVRFRAHLHALEKERDEREKEFSIQNSANRGKHE